MDWKSVLRFAGTTLVAFFIFKYLGDQRRYAEQVQDAQSSRDDPFGRLLSPAGTKAFPNFSDPVFKRIDAAKYGDQWPVTTGDVQVGCVLEVPMFTTIVVVDGLPYALNGTTKAWTRANGYELEINGGAFRVRESSTPEEWWRRGESTPRMSIYPLLDEAEAMGCLVPSALKGPAVSDGNE